MSITQDDFKKIWASTSSVPEYTFSDADYQNGWEFVGELPPTRAMWDTLQRRNDQKMKYLQDNGSMCFDSVADMISTDLEAGQTVITKGYYSVNDGGSALYTIRAKDVADVDDGGSIIFLDNGNVAELITDGTVNVKQFGAYGDGTHDDTVAIQNALNYIPNNGICYVPNGHYRVTSTLTTKANRYWQKLCGTTESGGTNAIDPIIHCIVFDGLASDGVGISIQGGGITVANLTITNSQINNGDTTIGIDASVGNSIYLENLALQRWNTAIKMSQVYYSYANKINCRYNNIAVYTYGCNNINFHALTVNGAPLDTQTDYVGIYNIGSQVNLINCSFETYRIGHKCAIYMGNSANVLCQGAYFESYATENDKPIASILNEGRDTMLTVTYSTAFIYGQESFVKCSNYKFVLNAHGNVFVNTLQEDSPVTIYKTPEHVSYYNSGSVNLYGDRYTLGDNTLTPIYIGPFDISALSTRLPNIHIIPPYVSSPTAIDEHEWNGKPQAWYLCTSAPSNPIRGATYWADGTYWNPLNLASNRFPYAVSYYGNAYHPVDRYNDMWGVVKDNSTLHNRDKVIVDNYQSILTITLPASPTEQDECTIKAAGGANNVTVTASHGIDWGGTTLTLTPKMCVTLRFNLYFNHWFIVSKA